MRPFTEQERALADFIERELPTAEVFANQPTGLIVMALAEPDEVRAHDVVRAAKLVLLEPGIGSIPVTITSK